MEANVFEYLTDRLFDADHAVMDLINKLNNYPYHDAGGQKEREQDLLDLAKQITERDQLRKEMSNAKKWARASY